jgi:hypothetical protein
MLRYNNKIKIVAIVFIFLLCLFLDLIFGEGSPPLFLTFFCVIVIAYEFISPYIKK